jgi:hypothetical protein
MEKVWINLRINKDLRENAKHYELKLSVFLEVRLSECFSMLEGQSKPPSKSQVGLLRSTQVNRRKIG